MNKSRAWLMLIFCNLFWAGNYVFGSYVVDELSPVWITVSRWVLALFLLFPIAQLLEKPEWKKSLRAWPALLAMGILGGSGYNIVLYAALQYTSSTSAALVQSLNPALLVLFSLFFLRERISKWQGAGILVSLLGVAVILCKGNLLQIFTTSYNRGDLLMILAVVIWTLYSVVSKRLQGVPPITATALSTVFGVLVALPFALSEGLPQLSNIHAIGIIGILYMALFPSVGSYILWNVGVRAIGASEAGVTLNLIPFFTALISLLLGKTLSAAQLAGGVLVIAGVMLTSGLLDRRLKAKRGPSQA